MSKDMMICPKAKECGIKAKVCAISRAKNLEPHCKPHQWKISCDSESVTHYCPACIPYIPEQPKKPVLRKSRPADEVAKWPKWKQDVDILKLTDEQKEAWHKLLSPADLQPAEMPLLNVWPLISQLMTAAREQSGFDFYGAWDIPADKFQEILSAWLPAHDSAVAAKARREFADAVIQGIPKLEVTVIGGEPVIMAIRDRIIAHIRAMAGKE